MAGALARMVRGVGSVPGRPRVQGVVVALMGATIAANLTYVLATAVTNRADGGYSTWLEGWVYHLAGGIPVLLVLSRGWVDRRYRWGWWVLSFGLAADLLGDLLSTFHDQNVGMPSPGWSDPPYLLARVAYAIALVIVTQRRVRAPRTVRLDGLVIGLSAGALTVALWFERILDQSGDRAAVLVGLAYPLFDALFVIIVLSGLAPAKFRPSWSAFAFMAGSLVFAAGDVVFLNRTALGTYHSGTVLDASWLVGRMIFGFAPWIAAGHRDVEAHGRTRLGLAFIPSLAGCIALAVIVVGLGGSVPSLAAWLAVAAIAAALIRVVLTNHELHTANEAFREARTDALTNLLNRRGFSEAVDERLRVADGELCMLMADLDGFKDVNDSLGHQAGDQLLTIVAERFDRAVPDGAVVARLGGDEFGVALVGSPANAQSTANALLASLADPIVLDGIGVRVGASIGLAHAAGGSAGGQELLRAADVAMYAAKAQHLGSAWYEAEHDPNTRDRLTFISALRAATERGELELHYQPIIELASGRVAGMEALVRWPHPTLGLLAPDEFIPLAERIGLMPAITRAALEQSIAKLAVSRRQGFDFGLSVNISRRDLLDEGLAPFVQSVLDDHDVPAARLTLELTETALFSDPTQAERTLERLRAKGIRISLDDFGVGYSSISQLINLPVDEVKIDRSFVTHIDRDRRARAVLGATVELGRTLGLDVVAEGIETIESLDEVCRRGVGCAQGYLFSPGLPAREFDRFVVTHARRLAEGRIGAGGRPLRPARSRRRASQR